MLRDSAHIQEMESQWRNKKAKRKVDGEEYEPIYTMDDAIEVIKLFVEYPYDKIFTVCDGVRFRFTDVGHLLGSASIELWLEEGNDLACVSDAGLPGVADPERTAEREAFFRERGIVPQGPRASADYRRAKEVIDANTPAKWAEQAAKEAAIVNKRLI